MPLTWEFVGGGVGGVAALASGEAHGPLLKIFSNAKEETHRKETNYIEIQFSKCLNHQFVMQ